MAEDEGSAIDKELQVKLYEDLGQHTTQKVGLVLGEVFEGATSWWANPLKLYNARRRLTYERNLKLLAEEINKIPDENIVEAPPEISEPVMQRLTYTSNEDVAKLYTKLLGTAASDRTASRAHPAFIEIIGRMSADEAKIIRHLKLKSVIGFVNVRARLTEKNAGGSVQISKNWTGIEKRVACQIPENMQVYLDNLGTLGIIYEQPQGELTNEKHYQPLYKLYEHEFNNLFMEYSNPLDYNGIAWNKGYYTITDFGKLFIEVCTSNTPINTNTII